MKIVPCYYAGDKMPWANYVASGNLIFLSGAEGRNPNKKQEYPALIEPKESPVPPTVEEETLNIWKKIKERLEDAGTSLENIIVINYYVQKRDYWHDAYRVMEKFWKENCPDILERPRAGTLLTEIGLDRADMKIEIEVIAELPKKSRRRTAGSTRSSKRRK
ncbi:MAG: Rid family hydrolase [Thaumarchaeota archaeon]|nr:Rid family hydrolase [Nitrososphaerota archaeon]